MEALLAMLVGMHPAVAVVLAALGALVVVGQAYVAITPSQDKIVLWFFISQSL